MAKKYKATVTASVKMTVWITEDLQGNQEIEDVEDIDEIEEFEIKSIHD